jgi:hypothetical protein
MTEEDPFANKNSNIASRLDKHKYIERGELIMQLEELKLAKSRRVLAVRSPA